ncbi:MAG: hypothetical protein CMH49_10420 [Myxococcales bacterium]|nr:hypothetical protein [Myxococcales bacterium]
MKITINIIINLAIIVCFAGCYQKAKAKPTNHRPAQKIKTSKSTQVPPSRSDQIQSQLLEKSGQAELGKQMPFFSGWAINNESGNAYSLRMTQKEGKSRYVLTVCASWCKPCLSGLKRLSEAKKRFISSNTGLIILVADHNRFGRKLYEEYGFDWANVVVDEFKVSSFKLAPSSRKQDESLSLPRTFVFNAEGMIEKIISIEGDDYVDLLFQSN